VWLQDHICGYGGGGERLVFPGHPANVGDMRVIDAALEACGIVWDEERLDKLRDGRTKI
jgi:hypothetical protein